MSNYDSKSGLSTKHWGPAGWKFLFSCIMGGYPPVMDAKNKEHQQIKQHFENMFISLGYTMPCIYCRESYKIFYSQLPPTKFFGSRISLMYWLYSIRDKVNKKLIAQEEKCYNDEKKRLKELVKRGKLSDDEYYKQIQEFKRHTMVTKSSPPFKEVLQMYENLRAKCSDKAKTCS